MAKIINSRYDLNKSWSDDQDNFYSQSAANELRLWVRMDPSTPDDLGPYNLSPTYAGAPPINEVRLGNMLYPAATFNDAANSYAHVKDTSGRLCFTSLGDLDPPTAGTDRPFSVSCWAIVDDVDSGDDYLFRKRGRGGSDNEYLGRISTEGGLHFQINDETLSGNRAYISLSGGTVSAGSWYHYVFTYDGQGGPTAANGLKIYVDGTLQSPSTIYNVSLYVGMEPSFANPLYIGAKSTGNHELTGQMAEFAVWGVELTASEITAIYNVTRQDGRDKTISGILNNPPRILLQDQDNATGSYPTVARTGDPDFTGRGNVFFDDTKTIEYFSSYATAEIEFSGRPRDADTLSLTGSTEASKRLFEFQRGVLRRYKSGVSGETVDSALVDITGRIQSPQSVAHAFAQTINSESIGIEATTLGPIVKLRQHTPVTGTYVQGNLISSSSRLSGRPIPIGVTQFKQHGPENYRYPMMLPPGYVHMNSSVATPNTLPTLQGPAIMGSNTSGVGITFTPGEKLTAFNETRIPIDNDDEFYTIGTPPSVLPGFNQRLSSKTSFSVDLTPTARTDILFTTGSAGQSVPVNSGLAYFNFSDSRWEIIGDLTTGSNIDYLNGETEQVTGSCLAVIPPYSMIADWAATSIDSRESWAKAAAPWIGLPTDAAGFPVASKFDATGSQLLDMSQYITAPFLLEKVVIEVSGAFGIPPTTRMCSEGLQSAKPLRNHDTLNPSPNPMTFMLLNQFETDLALSSSFSSRLTTLRPEPNVVKSVTSSIQSFPSTRAKDIVWFGRYGTFFQTTDTSLSVSSKWASPGGWINEEAFKDDLPTFHAAADTWTAVPNVHRHLPSASLGSSFITGSITIKAPPRVVSAAPEVRPSTFHRRAPDGTISSRLSNAPLFGIEHGGRDLFSLASGRSIVSSVLGSKPVGQHTTFAETNAGAEYFVDLYDTAEPIKDSPYVLMPTDKLVLAAVNQIYPYPPIDGVADFKYDRPYMYWWEGGEASDDAILPGTPDADGAGGYRIGIGSAPTALSVTFTPGSTGKITFYGSLLREGKPVDFTLNQPLTSDAIHEDVRDDFSPYGEARCLDQFDVDPTTSFRGGYLDNIVTGSMYGSGYVDPFAANTRAVQTSIVDGQAGITGSLQRFVRMTDSHEKFHDSYPPKILSVLTENGLGLLNITSIGKTMISVASPSTTSPSRGLDTAWFYRSAYEDVSERFIRQSYRGLRLLTYNSAGVSQGVLPLDLYRTCYAYFSSTGQNVNIFIGDEDANTESVASEKNMFKFLFGFGDGFIYGSGQTLTTLPIQGNVPNLRYVGPSPLHAEILVCVPEIRGWKYGLMNAFPTSPTAVFRYDTFGQFRDMLEPRPQSRFFDDDKLGESAVTIAFYDRDGTPGVKPSNTNSQNLSLFATSSVPYFDLPLTTFGRDRSTVQPDLDPSEDLEITTS